MKGIKGIKLGFAGAAAAAALAGGLFLAMSAMAASGTLMVTDGSAAPGEQGTVDLVANVEDPGLGAWTVDIVYDNTVVTAVDCAEESGSVCNAEFAEDTVRITGASASGLEGDATLGSVTFECGDDEGSSPLTIIAADEDHPFADATIGDPQPVDPLTITDGTFDCAVPTEEPTAEDTEAPPATALPETGTGSTGSGSDSIGWVIVALSAVGLAGVAGYGALRLRTR